METFNTVVGTLGLIVAIIALLHSIYYNLVKIKLSNCTIDRVDEGYDKIYSFEVSNLSNVSVMVTGIELYDKQGKLLNDTGFDPYQKYNNESYESRTSIPNTQLSSGWESYPFKYEVEVFPASRESFSYYLDEQPSQIVVKTDKRIHKFRKKKSFFPHFDDNC